MNDPLKVTFIDNGFAINAYCVSAVRQHALFGSRIKAEYFRECRRRHSPGAAAGAVAGVQSRSRVRRNSIWRKAFWQQDAVFGELLKERLIVNDVPLPEMLIGYRLAAAGQSTTAHSGSGGIWKTK